MAAKKKKPEQEDEIAEEVIEDTEDDTIVTSDVTLQTLERTVDRATKFIGALAESSAIRAFMARAGFEMSDLTEGRGYLMAVLTPIPPADVEAHRLLMDATDKKVADAVDALDALDEGHFAIAESALVSKFPAQHKALFTDLKPSQGYKAVFGWRKFLTRIDEMRQSKDPQDKAALARLAKRGLPESELKRLEKLLLVAEGSEAAVQQLEPNESGTSPERMTRLVALRQWFMEWLTVAKVHVRPKKLRIQLGIANRRKGGGGSGGQPPPA